METKGPELQGAQLLNEFETNPGYVRLYPRKKKTIIKTLLYVTINNILLTKYMFKTKNNYKNVLPFCKLSVWFSKILVNAHICWYIQLIIESHN